MRLSASCCRYVARFAERFNHLGQVDELQDAGQEPVIAEAAAAAAAAAAAGIPEEPLDRSQYSAKGRHSGPYDIPITEVSDVLRAFLGVQ